MEPAETQSLKTAPARPGRASGRVLVPTLQSRVERHVGRARLSRAFVGLNLLFLALGLAATYALLRLVFDFSPIWCAAVCCLVVLSRVFVWTAAVAVADIPFFALATACLLLLAVSRRTDKRRAWLAIGGAALVAAVAIEFRTVGVACCPAPLCVRRPPRGCVDFASTSSPAVAGVSRRSGGAPAARPRSRGRCGRDRLRRLR